MEVTPKTQNKSTGQHKKVTNEIQNKKGEIKTPKIIGKKRKTPYESNEFKELDDRKVKRRKKISPSVIYQDDQKGRRSILGLFAVNEITEVFVDPKKVLNLTLADLNKRVIYFNETEETGIYSSNTDLITALQHCGELKIERLSMSKRVLKGILVKIKIHSSPGKFVVSFRNGIKTLSFDLSEHELEGTTTNVKNYKKRISINEKKDFGKCFSICNVKFMFDKFSPHPIIDSPNRLKPRYEEITSQNQRAVNLYTTNAGKELHYSVKNPNSVKPPKVSTSKLDQFNFLPNTTLVFNQENDPCIKYNLSAITDKGYDIKSFTSYKLKDKIMCAEIEEEDGSMKLYYITFDTVLKKFVIYKLVNYKKQFIFNDLDWNEFLWGKFKVTIRNVDFKIKNFRYINKVKL